MPEPKHVGNGVYEFGGSIGDDQWKLVRRVQAGRTWHPATDELAGWDEYGTYSTDLRSHSTFSIPFVQMHCDEFLFATGDMKKWLVATRDSVLGSYYSNAQRQIERSSTSATPYKARWYHRNGHREDPWISLKDHSPSHNTGNILYGGNKYGNVHASTVLPLHKGANVFCKVHTGAGEHHSTACVHVPLSVRWLCAASVIMPTVIVSGAVSVY